MYSIIFCLIDIVTILERPYQLALKELVKSLRLPLKMQTFKMATHWLTILSDPSSKARRYDYRASTLAHEALQIHLGRYPCSK